MRIIYLHQYFNTPNMSGGTRSYEMARRLVDRGHEVHMVTSSRDGKPSGRHARGWTETVEAGIQVHWCSVPYSNHMSSRRRLGAFAKFSRLAARKATALRGDVVFATSTPLTIALPAVYAARRRSIPMVFEVRDLWPEMPIAVGALNVGSIRLTFHPVRTNRLASAAGHRDDDLHVDAARGDEMGWFEMGSSIVLLIAKETGRLDTLPEGHALRVGQRIGTLA